MYLKVFMISALVSCMMCFTSAALRKKLQVIKSSYDPGRCTKANHGSIKLVKDRENNDKVLICSQNNNIYGWKTIDGSKPLGEFFNPSYDCSHILNEDTNAKDGFYWVHFDESTPKQVWCDMTTDGGGFMLVGHKNSSITWTVPSNNDPVDPFGEPHWSSALGNAPILDFRVQMSDGSHFKQTKTHWLFRLNNKRPLRNLMVMGEKGCDQIAGIGDIAYVKDLQTEKVVTTNFRCSKFGLPHQAQTKTGWAMMNLCLQKPCPWGFAFHHKYPVQLDYSGAFSYSVAGKRSLGAIGNATAFVGCNQNNCCGCYGPVGGTKNYCTTKCKPINGGTVVKNVYTWFWVRSTLPKQVWRKCMEFKTRNENGKSVWYKLIGGNVIPSKGRCAKNEALLNDGIVVVRDEKIAKKIPSVPGLMAYRKDNKKLYVWSNKSWNVIPQEKKVLRNVFQMVKPKLDKFEKMLRNQNREALKMVNWLNRLERQLEKVNKTLEEQLASPADPGYTLHFKGNNIVDYVISQSAPAMTEISVCLWTKTKQQSLGYLVSYAVAGINNNFLMGIYPHLFIVMMEGPTTWKSGQSYISGSHNIAINDDIWHHVCVTWQSQGGKYSIYKDGKLGGQRSLAYTSGKTLRSGGTWVLGQDQDNVGGGFDASQSFQGELAEVNIWREVLSRAEISKMSKTCRPTRQGNVKSWSDFRSGIRGAVKISTPTCWV